MDEDTQTREDEAEQPQISKDNKIINKVMSRKTIVITVAIVFIIALLWEINTHGALNNRKEFIFGYKPLIVVSGSMEPEIAVNSISIIKEVTIDDINIGDVVVYNFYGMNVIHRVIDKEIDNHNQTYLVTKGDANASPDPVQVNSNTLVGKRVRTYNQVVPFMDYLMLREGEINPASVTKLVAGLFVILSISSLCLVKLYNIVSIMYVYQFKQDDIDNYIDELEKEFDKAEEYKEMIGRFRKKYKDNSKRNMIYKAYIIREMKELKKTMTEFEEEIKKTNRKH